MTRPILVVEDDSALVRTIVRNLEARGYTARSASTVSQAIGALSEGQPSLVLLDIDLPDAPGWDVVRELRRRGWSATPVIVVSALRPTERDASAGVEHGGELHHEHELAELHR